jgi:hypothetical protein
LTVQLEKLAGCDKVFKEKRSGVDAGRPALKACLEYLREGDTLIVTKLESNDRPHIPCKPDGKYFLKGGTRAVWEGFQLPLKWRSKLGQGLIEGKRCGVTQNIGPATRPSILLSIHLAPL